MDWSNALSRIVVPKRGLNAMRFQGERGLYEAWYLTFNARPDSLGVWIRYTIDTPIDGPGHCALWGHVFDARSPKRSFGFCARYPLTALSQPPRTLVQVGDARLEENRARGLFRRDGGGANRGCDGEGERGREEIDLLIAPPPDLAIEVDISTSSLDQLSIYADLGVPEVWLYDGTTLKVYQLQSDGKYVQQARSPAFPFLPLHDIEGFLTRRNETDETTWIRSFRAWVKTLVR